MADEHSFDELRTEWSAERTVLAIESTYAGWMRTGLAAIGVALGLHAIFSSGSAGVFARLTATGFVCLSALLCISGYRNARRMLEDVAHQWRLPRQADFTRITVLYLLGCVAIGVLIWQI